MNSDIVYAIAGFVSGLVFWILILSVITGIIAIPEMTVPQVPNQSALKTELKTEAEGLVSPTMDSRIEELMNGSEPPGVNGGGGRIIEGTFKSSIGDIPVCIILDQNSSDTGLMIPSNGTENCTRVQGVIK